MKTAAIRLIGFQVCLALATSSMTAAERPNIILLLADDFGHGHASCLNPRSKIPTPHIDRLAKSGMTFSDAHSGSAVCSPTRYGLLTGRYAWRTRLKRGVLGPYDPPLIEADRLTLPAMLQRQGYHTACIGKWHLGWTWPRVGENDPDFTQPIVDGPTTRGFHAYFGTDVPNYPPYCFIENDRTLGLPTSMKTEKNADGRIGPMLPSWKFDGILPEMSRRAVTLIESRAASPEPFFLYFPFTSPHEPVAPSAPYRGRTNLGPLADFLVETDAVVGEILAAVERSGQADRTLVIFTGDNGSSLYVGGRELEQQGHPVSAGFRAVKGSIYEGGHRVPFFVRWPGHVTPDSRCERTICLTDVMATIAEIVESPLPANAAEDSVSFHPLLRGQADAAKRPAVIHQSAAGRIAVRDGPWKLILPSVLVPENRASTKPASNPARPTEPLERELYNLLDDPAETTNVLADHPKIEAELASTFLRFQSEGRSRP